MLGNLSMSTPSSALAVIVENKISPSSKAPNHRFQETVITRKTLRYGELPPSILSTITMHKSVNPATLLRRDGESSIATVENCQPIDQVQQHITIYRDELSRRISEVATPGSQVSETTRVEASPQRRPTSSSNLRVSISPTIHWKEFSLSSLDPSPSGSEYSPSSQ